MDENVEIIKADNEAILKKHSAVIQMRNDITANQRKLFNAILYIAGKQLIDDPDSLFFKARFSDIRTFAGLTHETNYKYIKQALTALQKTNIEYNILEKDKEVEWGIFALLSEVKIRKEDEFIYFAFPPTIHDNIKYPNLYALLNMGIINGLKSKYSIALYELLQDYRKIAKFQLSIDDLKKLMGIGKSQYKVFTMFKQKILDVAVNEINTKTDLRVSFSLGLEGRKYTNIEFRIKSLMPNVLPVAIKNIDKPARGADGDQDSASADELIRQLLHYGFSTKHANKYLESLSRDEIARAIHLLESSMKKKNIKNPGGYLAVLLNNGSLFEENNFDDPQNVVELNKEKEIQAKNLSIRQLEKEYQPIYKARQTELLAAATDEDIEAFIEAHRYPSFMMDHLKRSGLLLENGGANKAAILKDSSFMLFMMDTYYSKQSEFIGFAAQKGYAVNIVNDEYVLE